MAKESVLNAQDQTIYVVDPETGYREQVAMTTMEELPEVISAISNEKSIHHIYLAGNSVLGNAVSEDITTYSKIHYNWNNIIVEVLK